MIDHRERLLLIRQVDVDPDHRAIPRQHRTKPLTPRIAPPVPTGRAATTLAHRDVLSGCVWDTKPALSHQEDVPASATARRTGTSRALSYYYALDRVDDLSSLCLMGRRCAGQRVQDRSAGGAVPT
jgi:hypothetical protein